MRELEDALALLEQKERVERELKVIETSERRHEHISNETLSLLFKAEHSKAYLEDVI